MKKHIPNFLTSLNVLSGSVACVLALEKSFFTAALFILAAAIFDFFDGFAARLLNVHSAIGKELDSLADVISFGLAPTLIVFQYINTISDLYPACPTIKYVAYLSFLIVIFSALRLAKFNVDERQTSSFIGLPTPANALFWISFCCGLTQTSQEVQQLSLIPTLMLIVVFSLLLPSEIPMFSLKVKSYKWKGNELRYLLIVFILVAIVSFGILGIATGIVFYIILSVVASKMQKKAI